MTDIIKVEDLDAGYGQLQVLFDVSLGFRERGITAIVGPNGSGKSTLLKTIMGLTRIYRGKIYFGEEEITGKPPHIVSRMGIAYLPQVGNVFSTLTVLENLKLASYTLDKEVADERIKEVLDFFPVLKQYLNRKTGRLSGGERQMVAMAMALLRRPRVMMFDEPSANLAPKLAVQIAEQIRRLRDELGITIIIVEQIVQLALEISEYAYLLVSGSVKFRGSSRDLLNRPDLGRLYLGIEG